MIIGLALPFWLGPLLVFFRMFALLTLAAFACDLAATYMGFALWGFASASASSLGAVVMEMSIFSINCETEDIKSSPFDVSRAPLVVACGQMRPGD